MKHKLTLLLGLFFLLSAFKADKPVITIFMIGDSTMANKMFVYFVRNYRLRNQAGQFNMIHNFSPFFFCNIHPFLINHIS